MSAEQIADQADMIVAGYAYRLHEDYVEVIDLNDTDKRAIIQDNQVVESMMSDEEDDLVLTYYIRNKEIVEEAVNA